MRPQENPATALTFDYCAHTGEISCWKTKQQKRDLYRDPLGSYWCELHKYRGELLLWASQHGYPHIAFWGNIIFLETRGPYLYAIGDDRCKPDDRRSLWEMIVLVGSDDMILAAHRHVFSEVEEI